MESRRRAFPFAPWSATPRGSDRRPPSTDRSPPLEDPVPPCHPPPRSTRTPVRSIPPLPRLVQSCRGTTRSSTRVATTPARPTSSCSGWHVLGPTATWLLRRLVAGFDDHPAGYELDLADDRPGARAQRTRTGTASPFAEALKRCVHVRRRQPASRSGCVVRRRLPPIVARHLLRMPPALQRAHEQWTATTFRRSTRLERAPCCARRWSPPATTAASSNRSSWRSASPPAPPPRPACRLMARFARWVGQGRPDHSRCCGRGPKRRESVRQSRPRDET